MMQIRNIPQKVETKINVQIKNSRVEILNKKNFFEACCKGKFRKKKIEIEISGEEDGDI